MGIGRLLYAETMFSNIPSFRGSLGHPVRELDKCDELSKRFTVIASILLFFLLNLCFEV